MSPDPKSLTSLLTNLSGLPGQARLPAGCHIRPPGLTRNALYPHAAHGATELAS